MLIKVCSDLIHPREITYPSKSHNGVVYTVVTPTILNDEFCTCPGWQFRGTCSHVEQAQFCDWYDPDTDATICPKCGGPTEDFETEPEYD